MKKFYEITKEDFKKEEREFKKTVYGKTLFEMKISLCVVELIFALFMIIPQFKPNADLMEIIVNNTTLWIGLLLSSGLNTLVQMRYTDALKEYIVNK